VISRWQQRNKQPIGGSKGTINLWQQANKEAVDGSQQSTCSIGGSKQTRNPSVTGSKLATILIFIFFLAIDISTFNTLTSLYR
jgi:hypothetical protein